MRTTTRYLPPGNYFWFCDFAPALYALFSYLGNTQGLIGFLNVILLPQIAYIVVVLTKALTGITLMHFTFTTPLTAGSVSVAVLIHLASIVVLWITYGERPRIAALGYSLLILCVTYGVVVTTVTPRGDDGTNYNLIFHSHLLSGFAYYSYFWIPFTFVFVVVPTHLALVILWRFSQRRNISGSTSNAH